MKGEGCYVHQGKETVKVGRSIGRANGRDNLYIQCASPFLLLW